MEAKKVYQGDLVEIFEVAPKIYFRSADLHTRGQCNGAYFIGDTGAAGLARPWADR